MEFFIGSGVTLALGLIGLVANRALNRSNAANAISEAAVRLVDPLSDRLDEVREQLVDSEARWKAAEGRLNDLAEENRLLRIWARVLQTQVLSLGAEPISFDSVRDAADC